MRWNDACLTGNNLAYGERNVNYQPMPRRDKQLTEPLVRWLADEMTRQGVDEVELSRRAKMQQAQLWKILRRKVAPEVATLERLARALGRHLPTLTLMPTPPLPDGQEMPRPAPRMPSDERSPSGASAVQPEAVPRGAPATLAPSPDVVPYREPTAGWGPLVYVLKQMPKEMQRDVAIRAVRQGIEAQELHGPQLLRAMLSMCKSLDGLGYVAMAREIRNEMMKALGDDLPSDELST